MFLVNTHWLQQQRHYTLSRASVITARPAKVQNDAVVFINNRRNIQIIASINTGLYPLQVQDGIIISPHAQ